MEQFFNQLLEIINTFISFFKDMLDKLGLDLGDIDIGGDA